MSFLNPDEQVRIKIRKVEEGDIASAGAKSPAPAPGAKPGAVAVPGSLAPKPVPAKPGVPIAGAKPGAPAPNAPAPTNVAVIVKTKQPPKVQVVQVEPGIFEVHFTCSCGEQYLIRCDSAEKSSAPSSPQ